MRLICLLVLFLAPIFASAQDIAQKEKWVEDYFYKGLAFSETEKDSSYYYYNRALKYAKELENHSDAIEILFSLILTSRNHGDLKRHRIFLDKIDTILEKEFVHEGSENLEYYQSRQTYEKATYLYDVKDYDKAKEYFRELYSTFWAKPSSRTELYDYNFFVHTTNYLALIYTNTGKYELAENYFRRSLNFIKNNPIAESEGYQLATVQLLSQLYRLTGEHEKSNLILEEALPAYKARFQSDKGYKNNLNAVYGKLVQNAIDQDSLRKALTYLKEGQRYLLDDDPFYKQYLLLYGDIYSNLEEDKALENYHKALSLFQGYRQNKPHQDIAEVQGKIAQFYLKQDDFQMGLEAIKKALSAAGSNIQITDFTENPDPNGVFSKTQLLHLLDLKLKLLKGKFEKSDDTAYLEAALNTNKDILRTFDLLKTEFDSKIDKQFLAETAYPIFHRMLEIAHMAYGKKPSPEVVKLALNIAEKNKDFLLLEVLRNANATQYGNIPQKVLDKEIQLRAQIAHREKELFDATETESGFSEELFALKQEYYSFLDSIKTNYPKYHDLKYGGKTLDLAQIRSEVVEDNGALVSYTMADEHLYVIVLNDAHETFLKLPFSENDKEKVRDFYNLLSRPSIANNGNDLSALGKHLFEKVLKKPLEGFGGKNLTIIPDGVLHYLPFDMLYENGSYLLEQKAVSYGNSVTSLLELREKRKGENEKLLAFAPEFNDEAVVELAEDQTRKFGKLTYNGEEVNGIERFYDTEIFLDNRATLANFKVKAPNSRIIHLATHASANDAYPDYSYLAFTKEKDSSRGNILYIKDLYNSSLNADMVTLSACQTGIGKLQKGQGMLSLSKGFYYAGAKSLVTTLWKINDKSTVKLIEYFYEGLSKGKSKTAALRDAKLKYLETTDDALLRHPYYWAAFVVSGDTDPITTKKNYWWIVTVGGSLLIFIVLYSKRRKSFRKVSLAS